MRIQKENIWEWFYIQHHLMTVLKVMIVLFALFILQDGFIKQIQTLYRSENPFRNLSIFASVWLLAIASMVAASLSKLKTIRLFWGIVFSTSAFAFLTFQNIMGYWPTLADAKILWVELGQADAAFAFYWSNLIMPFIVSTAFFVVFVLRPHANCMIRKALYNFIAGILPVLPFFLLAGSMILKGGGAAVGMPMGFFGLGAFSATLGYESLTQEKLPRENVQYEVLNSKLIENIVFIVDESISADFISVDLNNTLTPILANSKEFIADFGQASSGHNCSSFSNAILRWGINTRDLSRAELQPTIWQFAQKAGYRTAYIDAQKQPGTLGNFMDLREIKHIDKIIQFHSPQIERDREYISNDFKAAQATAKLIEEGQANFVYINKLGGHFPYEGKYPEEEAIFKPHMKLFEPIGRTNRQRLLNSYRNLIYWNLHHFFKIVLNEFDLENTVVIYTSDHGQNLLDEGVPTHCNRNTVSPYQALVPLLIITQNDSLLKVFQKASILNRDKASHFNIFSTILILMGYEKDKVEQDYEKSLFSPISRIGKYATGDLLNPMKHQRQFEWLNIPANLKSRMNDYLNHPLSFTDKLGLSFQ